MKSWRFAVPFASVVPKTLAKADGCMLAKDYTDEL